MNGDFFIFKLLLGSLCYNLTQCQQSECQKIGNFGVKNSFFHSFHPHMKRFALSALIPGEHRDISQMSTMRVPARLRFPFLFRV